MARLFDDAQSEYLERQEAVVTSAISYAITARFNSDVNNIHQTLVGLQDKDVDNQYARLLLSSAGNVWFQENDASAGHWAITSTTFSVDTWHLACGIRASATDRRALLDGGGKGTDVNSVTPINLDRTSIGRLGRATPIHYMSGMIAEIAIYDLSVWPGATASNKANNFEKILPSLAARCSPKAYPLGLVAYWDLVRDD